MDIIEKLFGLGFTFVGLLIWYLDYIILLTINELGTSLAAVFGFSGTIVLGIQIIGWTVVLGVLVALFVLGFAILYIGLEILSE